MKRHLAAGFGFLLLALAAWPVRPGEAEPTLSTVKKELRHQRQSLEDTWQRLQDEKKRLRGYQKKEGSLLGQLQDLDQRLSVTRNELETHEHNLAIIESRLGTLHSLADQDQQSLALHQQALAQRLVAIYKEGRWAPLDLLLSSRGPAQLLERAHFLRLMARQNADLLQAMRQEIGRVSDYASQYRDKQSQILALKEQAEQNRRELLKRKRAKNALRLSIRRKKDQVARVIAELNRAAQKLQDFVDSLEAQDRALRKRQARERRSGPSTFTLGGRHLWPVEGRLVSLYGWHRQSEFGTRVFNRGIEIAARAGTPFRAVASGRVLFADYFTGFGQMVILDHGANYYTLYAHAQRLFVEKGQRVTGGQALGEVGDSGSFGEPTLYFEVRKDGKAIDPLPWLRRHSKIQPTRRKRHG